MFRLFRILIDIMRKVVFILFAVMAMVAVAQPQVVKPDKSRPEVLLKTTMGKIVVELCNETPMHRDAFLKHVEQGDLDGVLFHRVIDGFVIQGGDPNTKEMPSTAYPAGPDDEDTPEFDPPIPAEIRYPELIHRRGALAAARTSDDVNPERKSSAYQWYIAWGKYYTIQELRDMQQQWEESDTPDMRPRMSRKIMEIYEAEGGIPRLDSLYTVFGHVTKGFEVVAQIQSVKTDSLDRPLKDVRVLKATITRK